MRRTEMNNSFKTVAVGTASLALAYAILVSPRPGQAMARTAAPAAIVPSSSGHSAGDMAATEHIAQMAMAGNIHAGHAMEEMAWPAFQAAPANGKLPADEAGASQRLAK